MSSKMSSYFKENIMSMPQLQPYIKKDITPTEKQLGKGAFGYVVELKMLGGAICAGKIIYETFLDLQNLGVERVVEKFVIECELMSKLHHPNIVHFYGITFLADSVSPVLVMERLDRSLDDFIEKTSARDVSLFLRLSILHDVAKGLVYLHSYQPRAPIVHRDLTARNVLLTTTKVAKIADLGNSRIIKTESLSESLSQTPGTLVYMPQEAVGSPAVYGASLDIFSFGHLTLYVLSHRFPCELLRSNYNDPNSNPPNKLCARSEVERRLVYFDNIEANSSIPLKLIAFIKQCLDNMPDLRPKSAEVSEMIKMQKEQQSKWERIEEPSTHTSSKPAYEREHSNQMAKIKGGSQFVMEVQVIKGKKTISWKKYIFQLNEGKLLYHKIAEKKQQELRLECLSAVDPEYTEQPNVCFLLQFEHKKETQTWRIKADTMEDRDCWVVALRDSMHPSKTNKLLAYEDVDTSFGSPSKEGEAYYSTHTRAVMEKGRPRLYTEPDAKFIEKSSKPIVRGATSLRQPLRKQFEEKLPPIPDKTPQTKRYFRHHQSSQNLTAKRPEKMYLRESTRRFSVPSEEYDDTINVLPTLSPKEIHQYEELPDASPYQNLGTLYATPPALPYRDRSKVISVKPSEKLVPGQTPPINSRPRSALLPKNSEQNESMTLSPSMYSSDTKTRRICRSASPDQSRERYEDNRASSSKWFQLPSIQTYSSSSATQQASSSSATQQGSSTSATQQGSSSSATQQGSSSSATQQGSSSSATQQVPTKSQKLLDTLYIPSNLLFEERHIGNGEFGDIYHAKLRNLTGEMVDVAVKSLQSPDNPTDKESFEKEMAISADPKLDHPNIVKVYGLVEGADKIVMQFLPYGDMKSFLCENMPAQEWLVKYMKDIAAGMTFLSERDLVHRDLAARNVLMGSNGETCKVSDFGLLRKLPSDSTYYFQAKSDKCPIRWMAPESLKDNKFSTASDVWSYGIVLWEMFKPQHIPFHEFGNVQVAVKVSCGERLTIPDNCPPSIGRIMNSCWQEKSRRPTFRQLGNELVHKL